MCIICVCMYMIHTYLSGNLLKLIIEIYLILAIKGKENCWKKEHLWKDRKNENSETRVGYLHAIILSARSRNKARRGTRRCDYVAYRGGMRGAIIAICINDPRTHWTRHMIAAGCSPGRFSQSANSSPGIRQNRTNPAGDNHVTFPILITDLN